MKNLTAKLSILFLALALIFTSVPQFAAEDTSNPNYILDPREDK